MEKATKQAIDYKNKNTVVQRGQEMYKKLDAFWFGDTKPQRQTTRKSLQSTY